MGGAMEYLPQGLGTLGKYLAYIYAIFLILGAIGAGNTFQVSQSLAVIQSEIPFFENYPYAFGLILAFVTGLVIIGGIKRIANVTEIIVPFMVIFYILMVFWVLAVNFNKIDDAFILIFKEAFSPTAVAGGIFGAMLQGFQRAVFSNEAGLGSAAIAHAPAKVKYPIRQGLVSLYEPFIDTVVVCTLTALVVIITGVYMGGTPELDMAIASKQGAIITSAGFGSVVSWFPHILGFAIFMFAFSTMISWSYYGERAWVYIFGIKSSIIFKFIFLAFIVIATIVDTGLMVDFSSILFLALAIPNILGLILLSDDVKNYLNEYISKLKSGELDREVEK
jgi:AGCS family alanine or glycine:cation symporter